MRISTRSKRSSHGFLDRTVAVISGFFATICFIAIVGASGPTTYVGNLTASGVISGNGSGVTNVLVPYTNITGNPSLVAGANVTITGTWPNQTVAATGGGSSFATNAQFATNSLLATNAIYAGTATNLTGGVYLDTVIFTSSGTYTPNPNMKSVYFTLEGAGGGGDGATNAFRSGNFAMGAAGASGQIVQGWFTKAQIGSSQTVTIGAGGSGGIANNIYVTGGGIAQPTGGGTSSLGSLLVAYGGNPGRGGPVSGSISQVPSVLDFGGIPNTNTPIGNCVSYGFSGDDACSQNYAGNYSHFPRGGGPNASRLTELTYAYLGFVGGPGFVVANQNGTNNFIEGANALGPNAGGSGSWDGTYGTNTWNGTNICIIGGAGGPGILTGYEFGY